MGALRPATERAARIFPELIVAVTAVTGKATLFSQEERVGLVKEAVAGLPNVTVTLFDGLLVEYARSQGVGVLIRGLRAFSDFEYEFQLALINRRLNRDIETVFLMTGYKWFYTSSTIINEAASLGGSVKGLVPEVVYQKLQEKFSTKNGSK